MAAMVERESPWPWERVRHPEKPSVAEHYAAMLKDFEQRLRPHLDTLTPEGERMFAFALATMRRESEGR